MTKPGDPDYDPDRHNYVKRSAAKRAADDLKYGIPALDKVKAALAPTEPCPQCGFTGVFDGHVCEDHMLSGNDASTP